MASHRVLTLSFEFHVPEGLRANIRSARLATAVAAITSAVQTLAPGHFPWADRIVVRSDWSYRWSENTDVIMMVATADNTLPGDTGLVSLDDGDALEPTQ